MNQSQNIVYSGKLNALSIDEVSEKISELLSELKVDTKNILKLRLSAEEVLGVWAKELGEEKTFYLTKTQRFKKVSLTLRADGKSVDPTQFQDSLLLSVSNNPNMAAALGLPAEYSYSGGENELKLHLPKKKQSSITSVVISMLCAIVFSLLLRSYSYEFAMTLEEQALAPLTNTITNVLKLIAGPLVFLSIVSGISGVGDASSFGKIGKTLVRRFLIVSIVTAIIAWLSISFMFPVSLQGGTGGENSVSKLVQMILDIIPADIVTPFQTGNAMQIIFLAACCGVGGIALGDSVIESVRVVNQINAIVQLLMSKISNLLPAFIFLCITNLILTSDISELYQIMSPLILTIIMTFLLVLIYGLYASIKVKIPFDYLIRSQFKTFFTALTTASSAAAFAYNVECCEKKLHIDDKLIRFGVPFGQVLFMPGVAIEYTVLPLFMAKLYGVTITPSWIITLVIIATILSVAQPPIPGGALSSISIILSQLNIPIAAVGMCATVLTFGDYCTTACNVTVLQQELLISAKKLGLLKNKQESIKN